MARPPGQDDRAARRRRSRRPGRPLLAQQLGEKFKQSFFIENRPGAAGIIGTAEAAKAAPDGYTILVVASPHINLEVLNHNKPYS